MSKECPANGAWSRIGVHGPLGDGARRTWTSPAWSSSSHDTTTVTATFGRQSHTCAEGADGDDSVAVETLSGPAEAVGLKEGDVVARINGQAANKAQVALADAGPGTPLTLTLQDGRTMRIVLAAYY